MIKCFNPFVAVVHLLLFYGCSCNDTSRCDTNEPLTINFKLETNGSVKKFVNLSEPACLIKKIQWDFDGDGAWDSEEVSPSLPIGEAVESVTLRINELNAVTKNISPRDSVSLSVDFKKEEAQEELIEQEEESEHISENDSVSDHKSEGAFAISVNNINQPTSVDYESNPNYSVNFVMPSNGFVGEPISMSANASVTNGSIDSYDWWIDEVQKSGKEITHSFVESDDFNVVLCVNGNRGCKSKKITIKKKSQPPPLPDPKPTPTPTPTPEPTPICKVDFTIPNQVDQCEEIKLNAISTDGDSKFEWVIDDEKKKGKKISYNFKKPGKYTINLCNKSTSDCCVSKIIVVKEVIEIDDDFYGKKLSNPIGGYAVCDEKEWINKSTLKINPKQSITLDKAVMWSSSGGKVNLVLEYVDACGETISSSLSRNVNGGRSELLLNKFPPLSSNQVYVFRIETQDDLKVLSNYNCKDMPKGDNRVKIDHQSGYSLFELQYKY